MFIDVPTNLTPDDILWEGDLERLDETFRGDAGLARTALGKIKWWSAAEALTSQTGQPWNKPVGNRDYTLVRLSCTLYPPKHKRDHYQEVKLFVSLKAIEGRGDVTAYSLFPGRITSTREGKFSVKLTPQLKFVDAIDAKLGETGVEIPYPYALPIVQAYGQGQKQVEWRFIHQSDHPLIGDLTTFLVVDTPADSNGFWLSSELQAVLETRIGFVSLGTSEVPPQKVVRSIR